MVMPNPIQDENAMESLDDLVTIGSGPDAKPYNVFIGHNMGYRTFTMIMPVREFFEHSEVANDPEEGPIAQRPLDVVHARKLAKYALQGLINASIEKYKAEGKVVPDAFYEVLELVGKQPYYSTQPLVCNLRECGPNGKKINGKKNITKEEQIASFKIWLSPSDVLWVVDGQHRRKGLELVFDFLKTVLSIASKGSGEKIIPKGNITLVDALKGQPLTNDFAKVFTEAFNSARTFATVSIELHLGLGIKEERQLFHDMNNLSKKVNVNTALNFDSANPVNQFISSFLESDIKLKVRDTEIKNWNEDDGSFARKDLLAINSRAFLNKNNASGITPAEFQDKVFIVQEMWSAIAKCEGFGLDGGKKRTVLHQPVVLKAIAKICFDLNFNRRRPENGEALYKKFLQLLPSIDFGHKNPMWTYYELSNTKRRELDLDTLAAFLPEEDPEVNRDIGSVQGGFMRFGAKHNDIFPLLADMLRWKTGLPSRR